METQMIETNYTINKINRKINKLRIELKCVFFQFYSISYFQIVVYKEILARKNVLGHYKHLIF